MSGVFDGSHPKTEAQFNELMNQRDSKEALLLIDRRMNEMKEHHRDTIILVDRRLNEISADAGIQKKLVESLHVELRDVRTQTTNTQRWVEDNSKITREVRDILSSFRLAGLISKWIIIIGAALTTMGVGITFMYGVVHGWFK